MITVSDYRQQKLLKNFIYENHLAADPELSNIRLCGTGIIHTQGHEPGIYVISNKHSIENKFWGHVTCRSAWSCPVCTAKVMAKYGTKIACLIDALAKWQNRYAVMITFTIPHTEGMSCKDTFKLLCDTWRLFNRKGNKKTTTKSYTLKNNAGERSKKGGRLGVGEKGTIKKYSYGKDIFADLKESLDIKHSVRVFEFTWGENSWHPHVHALYWLPKENIDKITDYEQKLAERWWNCAKQTCKKSFGDNLTQKLFPDWKKKYNLGLYISKDKNKARIQKSSYYITGWSGDAELTKNAYKYAHEGHYSPFQMLSMVQKDPDMPEDEKKKWLSLFIEYAKATKGHRRVQLSRGTENLNDIIKKWKQTNDYLEAYQKKSTVQQDWTMAYWFSEENWSKICKLELMTKTAVKAEILRLAKDLDKLEFFLQTLDPDLIMTRIPSSYRKDKEIFNWNKIKDRVA